MMKKSAEKKDRGQIFTGDGGYPSFGSPHNTKPPPPKKKPPRDSGKENEGEEGRKLRQTRKPKIGQRARRHDLINPNPKKNVET